MNIYIVTSGRPTKQITLKQGLQESKYPVTLVVPESQKWEYIANNLNQGSWLFHNKIGIKDTRQYIFDYNLGLYGKTKILMLDDDLTFYARNTINTGFHKATSSEVELMFESIDTMLGLYAHGGICEKFMSHAQPRDFVEGNRYYQVLAYNMALFPNPFPNFRLEIGEDIDMALQLRSQGLMSFTLTEFTKTDISHAPGGCADWRTVQVENEQTQKLADLWPEIVKIYPSKNFNGKGVKTRISWRKLDK